jgi:hypothetical protein
MKKSFKPLAILLAAMTMTTGAMAAEEIKTPVVETTANVLADYMVKLPSVSKSALEINGTRIELSKSPLVEIEGRLYLPMRKFAGLLGLSDDKITWNPDTNESAIEFGTLKFRYNLGTGIVYLNDKVYEADDQAFTTNNGTVYMNARLLCGFLGSNITWNADALSLGISKIGIVIPEDMVYIEPIEEIKGRRYTAEELDLLARIVEAEAKDQIYEGRVAVANVILNRVDSPQYPDTIYDVIYQGNSSGHPQFYPVRTGSINKKASELSIQAAKEALEGKVVVEGALYFNATWVTGSWASRNREFCKTIDSHNFYY